MDMTVLEKKGLNLILFHVNDVLFGVELFQVSEICEPTGGHLPSEIKALGEEFFGNSGKIKNGGKVFAMKNNTGARQDYGILTNDPEDIIEISLDNIRPLPAIVGKLKRYKSLWGGFIYKGEVGLLLDLEKFCAEVGVNKVAA